MTRSVKIPFRSVVTCPYCSAKLFWFPPVDEGLVSRQDCPKCRHTILIIDNVAHFDPSARKPPQRAESCPSRRKLHWNRIDSENKFIYEPARPKELPVCKRGQKQGQLFLDEAQLTRRYSQASGVRMRKKESLANRLLRPFAPFAYCAAL